MLTSPPNRCTQDILCIASKLLCMSLLSSHYQTHHHRTAPWHTSYGTAHAYHLRQSCIDGSCGHRLQLSIRQHTRPISHSAYMTIQCAIECWTITYMHCCNRRNTSI